MFNLQWKKDDPQSPSYVPSIFGAKNSQKYEQQQRRYEVLEHRRQKKEQVEDRDYPQRLPRSRVIVVGNSDMIPFYFTKICLMKIYETKKANYGIIIINCEYI